MRKIVLFLSIILFTASCKTDSQYINKITAKNSGIDSLTLPDNAIVKIYSPFTSELHSKINEKLSYTKKIMVRDDGNLQSTLGNFFADVGYEKANELFKAETGKEVDFAFFNYGGIRAGIMAGNITFENAFKLMPFDNTLVIVEMTGEKVQELVEYFVRQNRAHPISKQAQLIISNGKGDLKIGTKNLNLKKTYFVATTNYLFSGGDNMIFFKNPKSIVDTNYLLRQALIDGFKKQDTITGQLDNRVIIK